MLDIHMVNIYIHTYADLLIALSCIRTVLLTPVGHAEPTPAAHLRTAAPLPPANSSLASRISSCVSNIRLATSLEFQPLPIA